ncbi:MAG: hypothetical protein RBR97_20295 [Bacteroidales bacterium]|nr:hypothetical protein [Bacteroidales bacterium]
MKTTRALLITTFCLLYGCSINAPKTKDDRISLIDSLTIQKFHIDKLPEINNTKYFFLNKEKQQVIIRDTLSRQIQVCNFSHILSHILNLVLINDSIIFIDGIPNTIFFNLKNGDKKILFKNMDMTSNPILNNGNIYIAGIDLSIDTPLFTLNILDYSDNHLLPFSICDIEPKAKIEDLFLTGHLIKTQNRLAFIYDWLGEYYLINKHDEQILKNGFLPLMGNSKKFENNEYSPPYYQAYSTSVYKDSLIFILREVDFESVNPDSPHEKTVLSTLRKRIHIFNEDMELTDSFLLQKKATQIKIVGNKMYTLHHKDNIIYIYEINL